MSAPIVSVIVLTLNSERFIERCLRSLERQSLEDFEVLIVDAGSEDKTRDIVARRDRRFRWLELPGSDMGAARNHGMRHSTGRYITFLDSDDFYLRDKLERQVQELEANPDIDVTFCSAWHFRTERPDRIGRKRSSARPRVLKDFIEGRNHNLNTMCIRRGVWDAGFAFGEGDRGRYGEEWRLQLLMAQRAVPMGFGTEALVVTEIRPDSHTTWARQWIMKAQAIGELERVDGMLTSEQRSAVNLAAAVDDFRGKLVIALLLDGRIAEAEQVIGSIVESRRARWARFMVMLARFMPHRLLSGALLRLWLRRQDQSFEWQARPPALDRELQLLGA